MAQSKQEIQSLLAGGGTEPRHRFGQNFMIDQNLVRIVADAGQIAPEDLVIEVGPGTGTLTEELLSRGARVLAVEIDRGLARILRERFGVHERFQLIEGDALAGKHALNPQLMAQLQPAPSTCRPERSAAQSRDLGPEGAAQIRHDPPAPDPSTLLRFDRDDMEGDVRSGRDDSGGELRFDRGDGGAKLVANLPYNIASPLVIELLIAGVELLVFTVQKEVADRIRAAAGAEAYGPLSVMVQLMARVEVLRTLPPQAFWPPPKIESALVRLTRADRLGEDAKPFSRFVHQLFAARRKTLRKALSQIMDDPEAVLASLNIDGQLRPEVLTPEQFLQLYRAVSAT